MDPFEQAKHHFLLGLDHLEHKRYALAEQAFVQSLTWLPDRPSTLTNLAAAQIKLDKPALAQDAAHKALEQEPDNSQAWLNLGLASHELGQYEDALMAYDHALQLERDWVEALSNKGVTLLDLRRHDEALDCFERCLAMNPQDASTCANLGTLYSSTFDLDKAKLWFGRAIQADPSQAKYWFNQGNLCLQLRKPEEAYHCYEQAHRAEPDAEYVAGRLLYCCLHTAKWGQVPELTKRVTQMIGQGKKAALPFDAEAMLSDEAVLQAVCRKHASLITSPPSDQLLPSGVRQPGPLRIAYLCGEFNQHATAVLMAGVFECHDRHRFQITALDNSADDGSDIRRRIRAALPDWHAVQDMSTAELAQLIRRLGIDVLVDLNAHTGQNRAELMPMRAAPIQVNYLAFPGTFGSACMDYLIADATVIPPESRCHYDEKIVYLPHTYQANDRHRAISDTTPTRQELGLPQDAVVFCCFNNPYKIHPDTFDSWCRILHQVPGSVLWLLKDSDLATQRLRQEAARRGIEAERLIFAARMPVAEHLARHRAADLFLDTLPYNAHTTASDALWAGLPLLTLQGQTFPGRVGASLLRATGLPELITHTRADYEGRAIELAHNPAVLQALRDKLARQKDACPLFDTPLITRHLEKAYEMMHARHGNGLAPDHFSVPEH